MVGVFGSTDWPRGAVEAGHGRGRRAAAGRQPHPGATGIAELLPEVVGRRGGKRD